MLQLMLYFVSFVSVESSLLHFKFVYTRKSNNKHVFSKTIVPTMYQCAEICLAFEACQSFSFNRKSKQCFISKRAWDVEKLDSNKDFVYAYRSDIPKKLAGSCADKKCGINKICINPANSQSSCKPLYQCVNSWPYFDWFCTWGDVGGCDVANIGKNITTKDGKITRTWPRDVRNFAWDNCDRNCRKCDKLK